MNKRINTHAYYILILFISLAYAYSLASIIPMTDEIKDRLNYLSYPVNSAVIGFYYFSKGVLSFIFNEPLWLGLNAGLNLFLLPEQVVFGFVFFSSFVTSILILKSDPKYFLFLLFLLIFPQIIGKYVVHLRQGLAITIFLIGWFSVSKSWRWFFFVLTPFIHASFFFVIFLYGFVWVLKKLNFAIDLRTIAIILLGLMVGFSFGMLAGALGARQGELYGRNSADVSGLGFLFWFGVLVVYWLQGRDFTKENAFAMAALTFYLATYFFADITGRVFESMLIIVLLASLGLTSWRRKVFVAAILVFTGLSWLLRFNQPWLGWGVV